MTQYTFPLAYLGFPDSSVGKESACMQRSRFDSWVRKSHRGRDRLPTPVFLGSAGKESTCNEGDLGSIPRLRRSPGEGKAYPLQYSGLENSMDCIFHKVTKSWTRLRDIHFHFLSYPVLYPHTPYFQLFNTSSFTDPK